MQRDPLNTTDLIFGRNLVVSNWLLMLGLFHFLGYALLIIVFFRAGGPPFEPVSSFPALFFSAMIDYIVTNPAFPILLVAGLVGRALVKRRRTTPYTQDTETGAETPSCMLVSSFFGTSFQLPLWLLVPSISWVGYLAGEISKAYSADLPVGIPGWIGPRPHIDDFWADVVLPSLQLSMGTLGFWCFVTSVCSALLITDCQHDWSRKMRALVSALIISPVAIVAGGLLIMIPLGEKLEVKSEPIAESVLALHHAVLSGNKDEVTRMIDAGVDVNARGEKGDTPLNNAINTRDLGMMRLLIESGADISLPTATETTHLVSAVYSGSIDAVKLLIDSGADPNRRGQDQTAPLHPAARAKSYRMVETLIEAGAKVDPQDRKGRTPLSHAAEMHRPDVMNLLLDRGADIDATHGQGVTPLMDALCGFIRPDDPERRERALLSVKTLIDRGASIQPTTENAESALHCAARLGDLPVVERLISLGANVDQTSASGAPISQAASSSGMRAVEIAELFLQNGARLDIPDSLGFYPMHRAAQMGNIDMLKLLLKHGADPNVLSEIGKTPLQMAIEWDQKEAAAFLKEATRN